MDPLTHMLTGGIVADAMDASPRLGTRALPFALFAGAAPDLDVVPALIAAFPSNPFSAALLDPEWMRRLHRGYTHALPVILVAGIAFGLFGQRFFGGRKNTGGWIALALAVLFAHSLMDMTNGVVRFWLPFSVAAVGLGEAPEGDPILLVFLGGCLLANHPLRFENKRGWGTLTVLEKSGGWLRQNVGDRFEARWLARVCLCIVAVYLAVRTM